MSLVVYNSRDEVERKAQRWAHFIKGFMEQGKTPADLPRHLASEMIADLQNYYGNGQRRMPAAVARFLRPPKPQRSISTRAPPKRRAPYSGEAVMDELILPSAKRSPTNTLRSSVLPAIDPKTGLSRYNASQTGGPRSGSMVTPRMFSPDPRTVVARPLKRPYNAEFSIFRNPTGNPNIVDNSDPFIPAPPLGGGGRNIIRYPDGWVQPPSTAQGMTITPPPPEDRPGMLKVARSTLPTYNVPVSPFGPVSSTPSGIQEILMEPRTTHGSARRSFNTPPLPFSAPAWKPGDSIPSASEMLSATLPTGNALMNLHYPHVDSKGRRYKIDTSGAQSYSEFMREYADDGERINDGIASNNPGYGRRVAPGSVPAPATALGGAGARSSLSPRVYTIPRLPVSEVASPPDASDEALMILDEVIAATPPVARRSRVRPSELVLDTPTAAALDEASEIEAIVNSPDVRARAQQLRNSSLAKRHTRSMPANVRDSAKKLAEEALERFSRRNRGVAPSRYTPQ